MHRNSRFENGSTPYLVSSFRSPIKSLQAGYSHNLALLTNGDVYSWGLSRDGRLGQGVLLSYKYASAPVAKEIKQLSRKSIIAIGCSDQSSAALSTKGKLYFWGRGSYYKPEIGDTLIAGVPTPINEHVYVKRIRFGSNHCVVQDLDGYLYSWGKNSYGALGQGDTKFRGRPNYIEGVKEKEIVDFACGDGFTIVITKRRVKKVEVKFKSQVSFDSRRASLGFPQIKSRQPQFQDKMKQILRQSTLDETSFRKVNYKREDMPNLQPSGVTKLMEKFAQLKLRAPFRTGGKIYEERKSQENIEKIESDSSEEESSLSQEETVRIQRKDSKLMSKRVSNKEQFRIEEKLASILPLNRHSLTPSQHFKYRDSSEGKERRQILESKSANDLLSKSNINFYIRQSFEEPQRDFIKTKGHHYSKNQLKPSDIKDINISDLLGPSFKLAEINQKYKYMSRNQRTRLMAQMVWSLDQKLPKTDVLRRKLRLHQILKEKQRRKTIREANPLKKVIQVSPQEQSPVFIRQITKVQKEERPSKGLAQRKFREKLFQGTRMSKGDEELIRNSFNSSLKYSASLYAKALPKKLYHDNHSLGAERKANIPNTIASRLAEKHLNILIEKEDPIRTEVMKKLNPMMKKHKQELNQIQRYAPKNIE